MHNTAVIEGCDITFPQTQTILDGGDSSAAPADIQTVQGLRDAWRFALAHVDDPLNLYFICTVNRQICPKDADRWGVLRSKNTGGADAPHEPPAPRVAWLQEDLAKIDAIADPKARALDFFCYCVAAQLFRGGNKATATITATKLLMEHNLGVLTIDPASAKAFRNALLDLCSGGDSTGLRTILEHRIRTIEHWQSSEPEAPDRPIEMT